MAIVLNTNSYVTEAEADAYMVTRIDAANWTAATTANKEASLVTATQIIDNNAWIGYSVSSTQALAFPRKNAVYFDNRLGQTITIASDTVPDLIKTAVFEQALHLLNHEDLLEGTVQTFENISIGSISISDSNNDVTRISITPAYIMNPLRPLMHRGTSHGLHNQWWRAN